jgi:hypothetical protein
MLEAVTRVMMVEVPSVDELNAILFDLQAEQRNIISVDYNTMLPNGNMIFLVVYHITPGASLEENANSNVKEATETSS